MHHRKSNEAEIRKELNNSENMGETSTHTYLDPWQERRKNTEQGRSCRENDKVMTEDFP